MQLLLKFLHLHVDVYKRQEFKNALDDLLPKKLIPLIINLSNIPLDKKVNVITKEERKKLLHILKDLRVKIKGLRPIEEAIVTAGGVNTCLLYTSRCV